MSTRRRQAPPPSPDHRQLLLNHLHTLKISPVAQTLDALLAEAERAGWSYLEFAQRLLGDLANQRRERAIARRIADARFAEVCTLDRFDWAFNPAINRAQIERFVGAGVSKFVVVPLAEPADWDAELSKVADALLPLQRAA